MHPTFFQPKIFFGKEIFQLQIFFRQKTFRTKNCLEQTKLYSNIGQTNPAESKTVFKLKMTKIEDDQNGRQSKWKMTKMEDGQNGRRPKWKTTKMEDDQI